MEISVKDGSLGNVAKVDNNNRLYTDAVTRPEAVNAVLNGLGFNVSTGLITLTSANESAVFYLESDENNFLVFEEILVVFGGSTGGTGNGTIEIVKNPSTGTIIDNAAAVSTQSNRLFSSARLIDGNVYKGAEGNTITNGDTFALTSRSDFSTPVAFDAEIIALEKGNSIGVKYTPPAGNTSQTIIIAATVFIKS